MIQSAFAAAGRQLRGTTAFEIADEGDGDIQLVPKAMRDVSGRAPFSDSVTDQPPRGFGIRAAIKC